MRKILLLLLALTFLCFAEEDKHPWYLDIRGNKAFSNFQLEEQLDIPEEFGKMDTTKQDFMMRLSLENIKALYYSRSYYSLNLTMDIQRNYVAQDSCIRGYYITIRDGERYRFSGAKLIVPEDRKVEIDETKLNIAQDHLYNQDDIAEDMEDIQKAYRREGYLHTTLSSIEKIDTTQKKIYVEITIDPGAKVIMGNMNSSSHRTKDKRNPNIVISETGLTDTAWLSSLWRIPEGEIIDGNQYNTFRNKLFSTQLFTQIKMSDSLRSDGLSDVYLNVTERVPGETRYGFFFEEIYGFGAQASAKHKNFFGRLHEFSTSAQIAQHKQEASIGYANPLLFGTSFSFIPTAIRFEDRLTLNHEKINPPAYPDSLEERYEVINRGDLTFGLTKRIRFRSTLDTRYVNKNDSSLFKLKGEIALTFDYTNDYFNPTRGLRFAPTFGTGTNWKADIQNLTMVGDPYTYGEMTVNLYHPLFWTFNGAVSGSVGKFFAKAIEDDARIFYQGGTRSVRGYRFRSIFASNESTDENGDKIINTGLTPLYYRFNEEIRWTFPWKSWQRWQIVQFYDWTLVTDHEKDLYEERESESLGAGVRYRWQFLTFRLDYAFKKDLSNWNPEKFGWGRFAFDLSQTF
ncbi:Outer membrane protein assembly factor BamA [Fibrobacter sp. UWT2]|uniref:BamA/TamA family outer membrane protein n=1 Tax=Fibrobacter sp. UWT2 TaxID=1896224 RepID=UPI00091EE636|nr:BamA/TamA family outer membrane protein [Fibrobacter sp. UWT2]SHL49699.1 Outer membrane protein assembly factor BamA [Fibrobacter sp. UWT2]